MKSELVFIPYPGNSHLRSTVEIAKLLVAQETRLSITILIPPSEYGVADAEVDPSLLSDNRLRYKIIPGEHQKSSEPTILDKHVENQVSKVRHVVAKLIHEYSKLPDSPRIVGFVVDMFCTSTIDVANEFNVPSYLFYTSNAGFLGLTFHVQSLYDGGKYDVSETEFEDSEAELNVPSLTRPYPVRCLPHTLALKDWQQLFINQARRFRGMKGILVNTTAELEPHALKYLSSSENTPPVYSVGPLLHLDDDPKKKQSEILEWLDEQPAKSVVFLCFGSMGGFSEEQAREVAIALERSGRRFLWALRRASTDKKAPEEFKNLEEVLPEGFLERTKGRGKVIGWAPQVAVLANPAVGGFVTHCGWNSTLESLWFGVPTAAWPLYAEQKFNAFLMVEELGLAVEIKKHWRGDLFAAADAMETTKAEEIERGISCLMEKDSDVRKRVKEMSEKFHVALNEGGSLRNELKKFVEDVMKNSLELGR